MSESPYYPLVLYKRRVNVPEGAVDYPARIVPWDIHQRIERGLPVLVIVIRVREAL